MNRKAAPCWQMSDFEAVVFLLIVTLMVALAVIVAWEQSTVHRTTIPNELR